MFIEYKPGTKHAPTGSDKADTMDSFKDCGLILSDDDVVIDIDHLPKKSIEALISDFNLKTQVVWTDRGAHLYFTKAAWFSRRQDGICKLAFEIEQHTSRSNPNGMTVKRNGIERKIDNFGVRQPIPEIFKVGTKKNPYCDLTGLEEHGGRNKKLFEHRKALSNCDGWEKILRFINNHVFSDPMDEDEYKDVTRDTDISNTEDKYWVVSEIMSEYKTTLYMSTVWFMNRGRYTTDSDNRRLIRIIYQKCPEESTRYVDEIIKQIRYKSPYFDDETAFPIKFKNGYLKNGEFIRMKNFSDFTPYYINIDYDPDAPPVKIVDEYIDNLTGSDPDYRLLLLEALGYPMITDPEKIRAMGKFFMFRGDGANGKGTLLRIIEKIYNSKNCSTCSIRQLSDEKYAISTVGKLVNLGNGVELV